MMTIRWWSARWWAVPAQRKARLFSSPQLRSCENQKGAVLHQVHRTSYNFHLIFIRSPTLNMYIYIYILSIYLPIYLPIYLSYVCVCVYITLVLLRLQTQQRCRNRLGQCLEVCARRQVTFLMASASQRTTRWIPRGMWRAFGTAPWTWMSCKASGRRMLKGSRTSMGIQGPKIYNMGWDLWYLLWVKNTLFGCFDPQHLKAKTCGYDQFPSRQTWQTSWHPLWYRLWHHLAR